METTINNKSEEITANCGDKEITVGNKVLSSDKEYLEVYFDICQLYLLKRSILNKLKGTGSRLELSGKERFKSRIAVLNNRIQKQEDAFWQKAEDGKKHGVKFTIEEIAAKYKLDLFEKRLLLFFLYLEYFAIEKNVCMEDELLYIFDVEDSLLSRMRNMKYFMHGSILLKERLF